MDLNGIGIWSGELRYGDAGEKRDAAAELEALGLHRVVDPRRRR